jgi:hypothetical protein
MLLRFGCCKPTVQLCVPIESVLIAAQTRLLWSLASVCHSRSCNEHSVKQKQSVVVETMVHLYAPLCISSDMLPPKRNCVSVVSSTRYCLQSVSDHLCELLILQNTAQKLIAQHNSLAIELTILLFARCTVSVIVSQQQLLSGHFQCFANSWCFLVLIPVDVREA